MSIDFSKAPDGATHYAHSKSTSGRICFYKKIDDDLWFFDELGLWTGDPNIVDGCILVSSTTNELIEIPNLTVTCDNERQKMLCEQVVRMDRGEASEKRVHSGWYSLGGDSICVCDIYRAKPKKELVVPWEWLDLQIESLTVHEDKEVRVWDSVEKESYILPLKLDLTDIDLPVTVERPKC